MRRLLSTLFALALLAAGSAGAADRSEPHPHKGVLKPYAATFEPLLITAAEQATLDKGAPVFKETEGKIGGRGVAIFMVQASPATVWSTIKSFEKYPKWVDNVDKLEVYHRAPGRIDAYFSISAMAVGIDYFISHNLNEKERYLTWTLDYSKKSDLDDSVGYWKVDEVPGKPDQARVTYSVDIQIKGWVPGFIRTIIVDSGLKKATSWVKKYSERAWQAQRAK